MTLGRFLRTAPPASTIAWRQLDALPPDATSAGRHKISWSAVWKNRVRPLVYAVGRDAGRQERSAGWSGAAVECIHAYSLLHDDPAMDDDDLTTWSADCAQGLRRSTAIGGRCPADLVFILADTPCRPSIDGQPGADAECPARASGYLGMCGGQALDLDAEGRGSASTRAGAGAPPQRPGPSSSAP